MYGEKEISLAPRFFIIGFHIFVLICSAWLFFAGGYEWIGRQLGLVWIYGDLDRRFLLFSLSLIGLTSFCFKAFITFKRRLRWRELPGIMNAIVLYYSLFSLLGAGNLAPLGFMEWIGGILFLAGIGLTAGSEIQRLRFRSQPGKEQKLYTKGLFSVVRHPNYLGDITFVTGWALATGNWWSLLAPVWLFVMINLLFVRTLGKYLKDTYPQDYEAWQKKTPPLLPGLFWPKI